MRWVQLLPQSLASGCILQPPLADPEAQSQGGESRSGIASNHCLDGPQTHLPLNLGTLLLGFRPLCFQDTQEVPMFYNFEKKYNTELEIQGWQPGRVEGPMLR